MDQAVSPRGNPKGKQPYQKPTVKTTPIYETLALGCAQCVTPFIDVGFGDGNCGQNVYNY